ncbi:hypothetical protein BKA82DRAFT_150598, partial [Pisolithus tinctorius]
ELIPYSRPHTLPDIPIPFLVLCEADRISSVISQAYCHTKPSILVIDSNTICVWYLPDALSPKRRVRKCRISYSTDLMECIKASPQAWWTDKSYFHDNAELKGAINLSPTWFQQGHGMGDHFLPCE